MSTIRRGMIEARQESAYRQAGVDIDAGSRAVEGMKEAVRSTFGPRVLADVGLFGGLYALDERPDGQVLVASTDSVGTKLKLASLLGTHSLLGHDIVNHCTNDVLACGAKPIFFLDYFAAGKIVPEQVIEIVTGMAEACRAAGCALIGGETAELPGVYNEGEFDVVGTIVGMARRDMLVLGDRIVPGDIALALPSSGLHTNGYSLARRIVGERLRLSPSSAFPDEEGSVADVLLRVHRSYLAALRPVLQRVHAMAHITGGGLPGNLNRALPPDLDAVVDSSSWRVPNVFRVLERAGEVPRDEMFRAFNMGVGMVVICSRDDAQAVVESSLAASTPAWVMGELRPGSGIVVLK
jgi:phosphoribosylformylglycinamidine cyclo-ligase